jgi:hypothetical protein
MTPEQADFVRALESELAPRGVPISRAALMAFVAAAWPLVEDDPDLAFWADRFLETGPAVLSPI